MKHKNLKILFMIGIIALSLFLTFWMGCDIDAPNSPEMSYSLAPPADVIAHVMAIQEKHTKKLMEIPDVVGTAVGLAENNSPAILVLTKRGGVPGIPRALDGVPVKIEVTGEIVALKKPGTRPEPVDKVDPTARFNRPVPIGVSTGHPNITAGTIGCRVTNGANVYALSNNHVYADENKANTGDNVLQPGPYDGGIDPYDAIGTLDKFQTISFDGTENTIDAAIALSFTDKLGNATPSDGYGVPSSDTKIAMINMAVKKYGRTTGLTNASITGLNATVNVGYDSGVALFVGQIIIKKPGFSKPGDSGSLIVTKNGNNPVGLLFAGSNLYTIANPIDAVLTNLGVTVDGVK